MKKEDIYGRKTYPENPCPVCGGIEYPHGHSAPMQETKQKEIRVFVFVASMNDVPFFSKLFTDHTEMKEFSAKHSGEHKSHDDKIYTSTYFDLTDKSFISTLLAERDTYIRDNIDEILISTGGVPEKALPKIISFLTTNK